MNVSQKIEKITPEKIYSRTTLTLSRDSMTDCLFQNSASSVELMYTFAILLLRAASKWKSSLQHDQYCSLSLRRVDEYIGKAD